MIRLGISTEGATERAFVSVVLVEHLRRFGVEATPVLIRRPGHGYGAGGGDVSVDRLALHLAHLARSFDAVTCLVDFYGFRKKGTASVEDLEEQVRSAVVDRIRGRADRVLPYVQRFEFEGLLFSDVSRFDGLDQTPPGAVEELEKIRARFETPEDIDDGRTTAPSKRIAALIPGYDKVVQGPALAQRTGLPKIRAECPRFDAWVRRLEALGHEPDSTGE